jgi:hypothetical protein
MNIDGELAKLKPSVEAEESKSSEWIALMQALRDLPVLNPWERKGTSLFWRATYSFQVQKESIGGK